MFDELCRQLRRQATDLDRLGQWPRCQLDLCAQSEVFRWFVPTEFGGFAWNERQQLEGYLALSRCCLTTSFVLTQWNAACKRISASDNQSLRTEMLPKMARGELFVTVGISHLTTSRQHLSQPAVKAVLQGSGNWVLNGITPWVTGAACADVIVLGATLDDGRQILCAVPSDRAGVECRPGVPLVALTASCTDEVRLTNVEVCSSEVLFGPCLQVMQMGSGGASGGLQTSALAIGLAQAATNYLQDEALRRPDLLAVAHKLAHDVALLEHLLLALADGESPLQPSELRQQANSIVLRATQAALASAKGAGFIHGHEAGRWCREALFFLVWSCPQPVLNASLCELAQLTN